MICTGQQKNDFDQICNHYYYIDDAGFINYAIWTGSWIDLFRKEALGIFKYRGYAEQACKAAKKIKALSFEPDWDNSDQHKYYIFYGHDEKQDALVGRCFVGGMGAQGQIFFESEEIAKSSIKYYCELNELGVEYNEIFANAEIRSFRWGV